MSVRPIEVQGSFSQSQKVGKLQEQMQQRGQTNQDLIAQQQKEDEIKKRMQVNEFDKTDKSKFHKDGEKQQHEHPSHEKKNKEKQKKQQAHPYKGKFIDLTR